MAASAPTKQHKITEKSTINIMAKIIVIGSGFGGLSVAIRLAAGGHSVELFESRDKPGGRAYTYSINGFTFDGGPTVITAPFLFDDLWEVVGKKREDYVQFVRCDPFYRIFNQSGRAFNYNDDETYILDQIKQWEPADQQGYQNFMATTKTIFQKGFVELADQPFLHFTDMLKVAPDLIKMQSYKSVYSYVSQFVHNDFLRQCFSFHPLLIGGNPFDSPSIYAMIHYLERKWGIHYALGGTGALVNAMTTLLQETGGKITYNATVKEITVQNHKVTGVYLEDGSYHSADIIVSNADIAFTYQKLIPAQYRHIYTDRKLAHLQYSMSLFVLYFGTNRIYRNSTNLAHHNIILGPRYKGLLDDIFNKKTLASDFSLYLHMPTITDTTLAPDGCETFYVLAPVPNLDASVDWTKTAKIYRDRIVQFLQDNYLPGLADSIIAEHYIDPLHFKNVLNSYKGSAFSFQPTLTQSAWFRPHNRSEEFDNLYFVGAGTHPGAGLPGVLSSAIITDNLINGVTNSSAKKQKLLLEMS